MSTFGLLALIIGALIIRQVAVGRTLDIKSDAADFLNAVLGNGDVNEVLARRGSAMNSAIADGGSADNSSDPAISNPAESNAGGALLREARRLGAAAGNRYVWGAVGPSGYDCSGLVWRAMRNLGIYTGVRFTTATFPVIMTGRGIASKVSTPAPGDIVLWTGHMGIVSGPDRMYNAASKKSGIRESSISGHGGTPSYWRIKDTAVTHSQN